MIVINFKGIKFIVRWLNEQQSYQLMPANSKEDSKIDNMDRQVLIDGLQKYIKKKTNIDFTWVSSPAAGWIFRTWDLSGMMEKHLK